MRPEAGRRGLLLSAGGPGRAAGVRGLFLFLGALNLGAWAWAWSAFAGSPALLGTAVLAYVLGLRHAADADHIAAIDNVVRRLLQRGRRPQAAGLFFSLGHSTVVVLASAVLAWAAGLPPGNLEGARRVGSVLGTGISAFFLVGIGLSNLLVLQGLWRAFRRARRGGGLRPGETDAILEGRGFLSRLLRPLLSGITRSRQMYLVGFLFGLGFDTATEVGLLGLSASQAAHGLSPAVTLVFPALFTAGMTLADTTDSVLMTGAYGWAFVHPLRKLWYNLTLTSLSVLLALLVGSLEALGLLAFHGGLRGRPWSLVEGLNADTARFGLAVAGLFAAGWALSALLYRLKGFDKEEVRDY